MSESTHVAYTELIGGEDTGMTTNKGNPMFLFGGERWVTAPHLCKTEDGKFYIATWVARRNAMKWKGEFVGPGYKQMRPMSDDMHSAFSRVMELLQQINKLSQEAIAILQGQADSKLDEAADKIVNIMNKPRKRT